MRVSPLGALTLVLLVAGCGGAAATRRTPKVAVAVASAERRDIPYVIAASGTVEPRQTATISSPVGGIIQRVMFREGQDVTEGQPLFQIDPRPFQTALAQARGILARDIAQAKAARTEADRSQTMLEQQLISQHDYDTAHSNAEALEATVHADSAAVLTARLNLEYSTVRAPIGGRTGKLMVHVGDLVKANAPESPLVTINELHPILVRFAVPQIELPLVQRHEDAQPKTWVSPPGGDSIGVEGRLTFVDNQVDGATGTVLLKSEFENRDALLWPGEFVNVRLSLFTERNAIRVPAAAVVNAQSGTFVYVVKADSTVDMRPVKVARTAEEWSVIANGLAPGERVVTDGQLRLSPGSRATWKDPAGGASSAR